jgi:hypothetical protein
VHTASDGSGSDTDAQLNKAHLLGSFLTAVHGSQQQKTTKKQASGGVAGQPSLQLGFQLETLAATKSPIHRRSPATAPQLMYVGGECCEERRSVWKT